MSHVAVARDLRSEARDVNERRLLVLAGAHDACLDAAGDALEAIDVPREAATLVGRRDGALPCERVRPKHAHELLGTTRQAVIYDTHDACRPNALGRITGAVDGGGLLVLLAPPLAEWPDRRDGFDEGLAVPPFDRADVSGRFRDRLVETLRAHPGIAIVDAESGTVERDGLTHPAPRRPNPEPRPPEDPGFARAAYDACRTQDQVDAVHALEALREPGTAVVVEADRGRGKSSAAGLAAGCLAATGDDVLVTAPNYRNASELFARASELLDRRGELAVEPDGESGPGPRELRTAAGGRVRYAKPPAAADLPDDPDVTMVDEAAALPVRLLGDFLAADRVAFATTVHGYEGAGRGFDVRFREDLAASDHELVEATLDEPIRYAAGDPIEVWAFRALCLDARPAVDPLVADASPESVAYEALSQDDLRADENLLREAFGLLVFAHYRTEPDDLARLLDAPNVTVRALLHDGHVASVALLAREGGLPAEVRQDMYEGSRVRGNMLPDVLTSQLRDEAAAETVGFRVMRIATHHAVRSRGLGSRLLAEIREEVAEAVDWLGVGYGATPDLLDFWDSNGYGTLHVSTTRNDTSGEYSAIMLDPLSGAGRELHDRHAGRFADRAPGVLADPLRDLDPDVARAALRACDATPALDLADDDWRLVAGAAYGPALYSVDPAPFRDLAANHLVAGDPDLLDARQERLLVLKVLQARPWEAVVDRLDFHSRGQAMRTLGDAYRPLVDAYGDEVAETEAERFRS